MFFCVLGIPGYRSQSVWLHVCMEKFTEFNQSAEYAFCHNRRQSWWAFAVRRVHLACNYSRRLLMWGSIWLSFACLSCISFSSFVANCEARIRDMLLTYRKRMLTRSRSLSNGRPMHYALLCCFFNSPSAHLASSQAASRDFCAITWHQIIALFGLLIFLVFSTLNMPCMFLECGRENPRSWMSILQIKEN